MAYYWFHFCFQFVLGDYTACAYTKVEDTANCWYAGFSMVLQRNDGGLTIKVVDAFIWAERKTNFISEI